MATATKIIDIERSYVPIDPNSFPESMHGTGAEDAPEGRIPVVPYDGYNFMPTAYGYMSFFGINSILGINALTKLTTPFDLLRVDDLFIVQTPDLRNILVALTEDGIYTKYAGSTGAWTHAVILTEPAAGVHYNWTKCVIGNEVYMYRAGGAKLYVMREGESFVPTELTPNTLNMAAQQGIFKAGGRLGFWDSANSIAWSDVDVKTDFVLSLKTGAGATIFQHIVGKIVTVLQHEQGFVIYCTRSVVHVHRNADANFFWQSESIFDNNGISYMNEATMGQPDTTHFAYTTFGMVKIEHGKYEYIIPEVFTYLKEKRDPVYLRLLEGRYLFLQFLNSAFNLGIPNFSHEGVPATTFTFKGASYAIDHITESPCKAIRATDSSFEGAYLFNTYGYTSKSQATIPGQVPIWEDHLSLNIAIAIMKAYKATGVSGMGSPDYFNNTGFTVGTIAKIDGSGNEAFIPTNSVPLIADYSGSPLLAPIDLTEDNTQDFFSKQDFAWLYEQHFFDDWKEAIIKKAHTEITIGGAAQLFASAFGTPGITRTKHTFGPYIDLSFFSESNKYYGVADKSAWLQRSLTKGIEIDVDEIITNTDLVECGWAEAYYAPVSGSGFFSYIVGSYTNFDTLLVAALALAFPGAGYFIFSKTEFAGTAIQNRHIEVVVHSPTLDPLTLELYPTRSTAIDGDGGIGQANNQRVYISTTDFATPQILATGLGVFTGTQTQGFSTPIFRSVSYPVCIYKNLGYTKIKGHGHYNLLGNFVVDDATPEAADYIDQCITPPAKTRNTLFNGIQIPTTTPTGCLAQEATIDTEIFAYPDQTITLPTSSFLMQDGSIEPIYPTFEGAFVYDLQYKKWGKMVQPHKWLLNYSPINSQAGDKPVPTDIFSVNAGCLLEDGTIALFDKYPNDSLIKWGKIGYYRKGFTDCEDITVQFREPATGAIIVEGSFDGKNIEPAISQIKTFENVNQVTGKFSNSARWFNVGISGIYDIKNIDFNGHKKGKR